MMLAAAGYVAAGGYVHLREWFEQYRSVPASVSGAAVVRVGFPINAAVSVVLAALLVAAAVRLPRLAVPAIVATAAFQAAALALLVASRVGSVAGWSEPAWTLGAEQARAVEIGALLSLAAAAGLGWMRARSRRVHLQPARVTRRIPRT